MGTIRPGRSPFTVAAGMPSEQGSARLAAPTAAAVLNGGKPLEAIAARPSSAGEHLLPLHVTEEMGHAGYEFSTEGP